MLSKVLLLAMSLAVAAPAAGDDGFRLVVHRSNAVASLSRAQASQLFLKKSTRWPGGVVVAPVELADAAVRKRFYERVHDKSPNAVRAYWNQLIFSGRDVPPLERRSDAEVLAYVRAHPGAIGLVSASAALDDVKAVPLKD
jgi:ABC-type phosphate transport system substrate-binding protein